jgi:hypothetical protein
MQTSQTLQRHNKLRITVFHSTINVPNILANEQTKHDRPRQALVLEATSRDEVVYAPFGARLVAEL